MVVAAVVVVVVVCDAVVVVARRLSSLSVARAGVSGVGPMSCAACVGQTSAECYSNHIITRIRIPTAGVAFGRHRSVFLSC